MNKESNSNSQESNTSIYFAGDNIIDHHIYIKQKEGLDYPTLLQKSQNGGAHLLFSLIKKFKSLKIAFGEEKPLLDNYDLIFGQKKISRRIKEDETCRVETGLLWKPFRLTNDKRKPGSKVFHWRISNKLGYGHTFRGNRNIAEFIFDEGISPKEGDILVIDDGGLEFRKQETAHRKLLKNNWKYIILKVSNPIASGPLFHELIEHHSEKLIVITTANELRKSNVRISKGVSWEQSITDLVLELNQNKQIKDLKKCKSLIVTFSTEGAFYIENSKNGKDEITKYRLLFDNKYLEGEFIDEEISGEVFGYQSTFTLAIILGLISYDRKPKENKDALETMINNGLSATRTLAINGHGNINTTNPEYPYKEVFEDLVNPTMTYGFAFVPQPDLVKQSDFDNWSILKGNYALENQKEPLFDEAISHIIKRKTGLINAPQYAVNYFFTVDRKEIEGLRNIKQLVLAYNKDKRENKPISIAVFGSPGSGKSFVVKQLEKGINIQNTSFLEFNLSQFSNPEDIIGALHQVRDEILDGNLPFVFWDEFDSKQYMWLQYLLAPMQDGKFQEGQITHSIGRCVFIFAGGTSNDFDHFGQLEPNKPEDPTSAAEMDKYKLELAEYKEKYRKFENFKLKKGPDFKSRLNGYLNIMGPNQEYSFNEKTERWDIPNENDVYYPIRRAILFNALSGFNASKNTVDSSLLNAILKISKYNHGARSFEKVIKSIFQDSNGKMLRSNLPPDTLLNSHVDKQEFVRLITDSKELDLAANKIAEDVHNFWKALGDKQGWKLEYHRDFDYLPTHIKKENVAAVLRIPGILEAAGYTITDNPIYSDTRLFEKDIKDPDLLKKLAIIEHEGWCKFKEDNGWKYNAKRNDDKKHHNCLKPFNQLSKKDQDKDKDAINNFPDVLGKADLFVKKK